MPSPEQRRTFGSQLSGGLQSCFPLQHLQVTGSYTIIAQTAAEMMVQRVECPLRVKSRNPDLPCPASAQPLKADTSVAPSHVNSGLLRV